MLISVLIRLAYTPLVFIYLVSVFSFTYASEFHDEWLLLLVANGHYSLLITTFSLHIVICKFIYVQVDG